MQVALLLGKDLYVITKYFWPKFEGQTFSKVMLWST